MTKRKEAFQKTISIILLLSCIMIVACQSPQEKTLKIGGLFHLSGDGAYWGNGEKNGALLAIEEINAQGGIEGTPLEIIIEDGQTDFSSTATATRKLIDVEKVMGIIGPTWFGQVAGPIAEETRTIIISPSTGISIPREKYFFNLWPTENQEITPLVQYMKSQNDSRIILIYSQNDWALSMKKVFEKEAQKHNISLVQEFEVSPQENDFGTITTKIDSIDADAIYGIFAFYPSQGAFTKQLREKEISLPLYSTSGTENPELIAIFPQVDGTTYSYPDIGDRERDFEEKYARTYGHTAPPSAGPAYDATILFSKALKSGARTPEEIAEYLEQMSTHTGVSNDIQFENGRLTEKKHVVKQVRDGKFITIG